MLLLASHGQGTVCVNELRGDGRLNTLPEGTHPSRRMQQRSRFVDCPPRPTDRVAILGEPPITAHMRSL